MVEESRPWAGNVFTGSPGDAGPYSDGQWDDIWETLYGSGGPALGPYVNRGVIRNWLNELAVSSPAANTARVATGAALVHGKFYRNTDNEDKNIPTPDDDTRIDRIVLRSIWADQTIRITRLVGVEGGGAPAITQEDGVTWDIPLAQVSITIVPAITITDEREYVSDLMQPKQLQVKPGLVDITGGEWAHIVDHQGVRLDIPGDVAYFEFMVPLDFQQLVAAYVRFIAAPTGSIDWTATMNAGGCGESASAITDTATANALAVTAGQIKCLDISAAFGGIGAEDQVGIAFTVDVFTTVIDVLVLQLDFRYK